MTQPQPAPSYTPASATSRTNRLYVAVIIVLSVALVVSSTTAVLFYEQKVFQLNTQIQRTSDLGSQNTNLQNQNANLQNQINQLQSEINSLQSQLKNLEANVVNVTDLSGSVTTSGSPVSIVFYSGSSTHPSASSAVFSDNSYSVVLENGVNYTVKIVYVYLGTIYNCNATPSVYSIPSGPSTTLSENFFC